MSKHGVVKDRLPVFIGSSGIRQDVGYLVSRRDVATNPMKFSFVTRLLVLFVEAYWVTECDCRKLSRNLFLVHDPNVLKHDLLNIFGVIVGLKTREELLLCFCVCYV